MEERLQKILARAGFGSRRACEELIRQGRVRINGRLARLGERADPQRQCITVDGRSVALETAPTYVAVHKPRGVLSAVQDDRRRPTVRDLVPLPGHLFPVGRLDARSEGLMLLTDDGELAHRLTHPRFGHEKEYRVLVEGQPSETVLERWRRGIYLDGRRTAPARVTVTGQEGRHTWLRVTLREGRKQQIRRVAAALGHPVQRLIRVRIGPVRLRNLEAGRWRRLTAREVAALQAQVKGTRSLKPSTIAIDGPAASGKSTIGGLLAARLGYLYFDTGVMYRAVTWVALQRGIPIEDEEAVTALAEELQIDVTPPTADDGRQYTVLADGEDVTWAIRTPEVDANVSPVSAYAGVRVALTPQQRRIGQRGRVVIVGRDIGTVVLPDADFKLYLDATDEERARRRWREIRARGGETDYRAVLASMCRRDRIDSNRAVAPLKPARDAVVVDTTDLSIDEVLAEVERLMENGGWRMEV